MKMKTTAPNPLFAKIRLFLIVLTSCVNRHLYFLDYYSSGSMDDTGMRNYYRIVYFTISGILHTQEPEENLNILLLFQLFSNSNQLFVPFFTELTD